MGRPRVGSMGHGWWKTILSHFARFEGSEQKNEIRMKIEWFRMQSKEEFFPFLHANHPQEDPEHDREVTIKTHRQTVALLWQLQVFGKFIYFLTLQNGRSN